jgi:hypothetical protein
LSSYIKIVNIKNITLNDLKLSSIKKTFNLLYKDKLFFTINDIDVDNKLINSKSNDKSKYKLPKIPIVFNKDDNNEMLSNQSRITINSSNSFGSGVSNEIGYNNNESNSNNNESNSNNNNIGTNGNSYNINNVSNIDNVSNASIPIAYDPYTISRTPVYGPSINNQIPYAFNNPIGNVPINNVSYNVPRNIINNSDFILFGGSSQGSSIYSRSIRGDIIRSGTPPMAPRPSNFSTPSTMTPLFPSSENVNAWSHPSLVPRPLSLNRSQVPSSISSISLSNNDSQNNINIGNNVLYNPNNLNMPLNNVNFVRYNSLEISLASNQASIGDVSLPAKDQAIMAINREYEINNDIFVSREEISIKKSGFMGRFRIGFDTLKSKFSNEKIKIISAFAHYENVAKRHMV